LQVDLPVRRPTDRGGLDAERDVRQGEGPIGHGDEEEPGGDGGEGKARLTAHLFPGLLVRTVTGTAQGIRPDRRGFE
jgi:hypothetical protein